MYTCNLKFQLQVYIAKMVYLQVHNFGYVYLYLQVYIAFTLKLFQVLKVIKSFKTPASLPSEKISINMRLGYTI